MSVFEPTAQTFIYKLVEELIAIVQTLRKYIGHTNVEAASMVGGKNSALSRIKNESPNCVQMKCIFNFLYLCTKMHYERYLQIWFAFDRNAFMIQ